MLKKDYYTASELAKILGISRVAVAKKIKQGHIQANKVGPVFAIPYAEVAGLLGEALTKRQKATIEAAVKKTTNQYGEALKLLGET